MRNRTFRIVKSRLTPKVLATEVLAPARGKGQFPPAYTPPTSSAGGAYLWANCWTVGLFRCGAS